MRAFSNVSPKADLRVHARESVHRQAKVLDGHFAVDAIITDISPGELRLALGSRAPNAETLIIVDLGPGVAYEGRVVWRKGTECGLRILRSQDLRGLVAGQFDAARRLWLAAQRRS